MRNKDISGLPDAFDYKKGSNKFNKINYQVKNSPKVSVEAKHLNEV
jgi:hypothetical protein